MNADNINLDYFLDLLKSFSNSPYSLDIWHYDHMDEEQYPHQASYSSSTSPLSRTLDDPNDTGHQTQCSQDYDSAVDGELLGVDVVGSNIGAIVGVILTRYDRHDC